jgi:lauroyl/myristoyl acyltransferase
MSHPPEAASRPLPDRVRDAALRGLHRTGWRSAARVPRPLVRAVAAVGARLAVRVGGPYITTLRRNLTLTTGAPASDALVRAGLRSYLRTFWEVLALPGWSRETVLARVRTEGEERLRGAFAGPGCVVALPHSGNWDLAGAWACSTGMPVSTVAEQLSGSEFEAFLAFRRGLGMEVLSHRDRSAVPALAAALRRGRPAS